VNKKKHYLCFSGGILYSGIRFFAAMFVVLCLGWHGAAFATVTLVSDGYLISQLSQKQPVGDYALKADIPTVPTNLSQFNNDSGFISNGALTEYIKRNEVTNLLSAKADVSTVTAHIDNVENPHAVTKAQVGLSNVENVNQTNASNLTSGTVSYARLPVGTSTNTVAAGDDVRFSTIPTTTPTGTPPAGQVYIWFN
jgi:hypothetical protein